MTTFTARWVLPVAGPPLAGGLVTVAGDRIEAVEPPSTRPADVDLGNVAVIPGLVNAHTHLDLSGARGRTPPTDAEHFTDWLRAVIAFRRGRTPDEVQADVRAGLAELLASGTTLVGDITAGGASWDAVSGAPVRAVVYEELIGLDPNALLAAWGRVEDAGPTATATTRPGVSPHAPYSVHGDTARGIFAAGIQSATHVAETAAEADLLVSGTGPFVDFLQRLGVHRERSHAQSWEAFLDPFGGRLRRPATRLVVHANYVPADFPFRPEHSVVYCPRTHAAFGHPPHPFRHFLARWVRVCLGTDGLTSNPDLDVLAEARFVAAHYPDFPGDQLLRMVTLSGAEALGWADECGSLEPGKSADFVAVPLPDRDGDVYGLLFAEDCGARRTMFRGEWRD